MYYFIPTSRWQAVQLGLYKTNLSHCTLFFTKKVKIANLIAQLKRLLLSDAQAEKAIVAVLDNDGYKKYHKYFIQELFYLYPDVFVDFFITHQYWLNNHYYCGLYLSYLGCDNLDQCQKFFEDNTNQDNKLIYSNLFLDANIQKLTYFNDILHTFELSPIVLSDKTGRFCVNNLKSNKAVLKKRYGQVSVLVTAYNASDTIKCCLDSLLNQTYQNLQIIVIDDNSDDNTVEMVKSIKDDRILLIALPKNVGTFAAKSIGARFVTGEYLTCQDSDDWAHPQKIQEQVLPLIEDGALIATTSQWLRIDENGNYYARHYYPFLRHNPASPLFRYDKVKKDMGLWHIVRTGADSEFFERLKAVYGTQKIKAIKKPLTLASHRSNSLMTSVEYGAYHAKSALDRLDYWEAWRLWHIDVLSNKQTPYMPEIETQFIKPMFDVPNKLRVNFDDIKYNLEHLLIWKI